MDPAANRCGPPKEGDRADPVGPLRLPASRSGLEPGAARSRPAGRPERLARAHERAREDRDDSGFVLGLRGTGRRHVRTPGCNRRAETFSIKMYIHLDGGDGHVTNDGRGNETLGRAPRTGRGEAGGRAPRRCRAVGVWFAAAVAAGASGLVNQPGRPPLVLAGFLVVPILGFLAADAASSSFRAFTDTIPLTLLVGSHVWRFVGLGFLAGAFTGALPMGFGIPEGVGDVVAAVGALVLLPAVGEAGPRAGGCSPGTSSDSSTSCRRSPWACLLPRVQWGSCTRRRPTPRSW